jgi:hypothetical protein
MSPTRSSRTSMITACGFPSKIIWQQQRGYRRRYTGEQPGVNGTRTIRFGIGPINVPDRVAAGLLFLGPVVAALMLLVLGAIRNYRSDGSTENSNWPASSSCELIAVTYRERWGRRPTATTICALWAGKSAARWCVARRAADGPPRHDLPLTPGQRRRRRLDQRTAQSGTARTVLQVGAVPARSALT